MNCTLIEAADLMPAFFDAGVSVEMIGPPGLGKSEVIEQLVHTLSARDGEPWGFAKMFLATQTPPDLMGYMMPETKEFDGKSVRVSSWTMPGWMQTSDGLPVTHYRRGILFLDEYGQGEADVKRASAELLLNHGLGPWKLPDGWAIVAASNRSSDRSGVTKSFDFVINRRAELHIYPDVNSWEQWALANHVSATTITFAKQNVEIVFNGNVPDKQGPWCTPRSLVMADKVLRRLARNGEGVPDNPQSLRAVTSLIGEAAARQYFVFLRLEEEMPKIERIVADPSGVKTPDKVDAQMLVTYHLAHNATLDHMEPFVKYIKRMGDEFAVTFLKAAVARKSELKRSPVLLQWCKDNSALMAAIR